MELRLHSSAPDSVTFHSADLAKPCCERLGRGSGGKGSPHSLQPRFPFFWGARAPRKGGSPFSSSPSRRGSHKFTGSVEGCAKREGVGGWGKGGWEKGQDGEKGWEKGSGQGKGVGEGVRTGKGG